MKILGIGNALVDILIRIKNETMLADLNLPKGSMQLVDKQRSDTILSTFSGIPSSLAAGGSAANTMHGLAMLGMSAGYMGVVGNDPLGVSFESDMTQAGVVPYLFRSETETGHAITLITPDSERTFATFLGAAVELSPENLLNPKIQAPHPVKNLFSHYDYLHVEGYLVYNHELVRTALELAKANGLIVSLDLASYNVVEANHAFLDEMIRKYVDILFANEEEALAFTGFKPEKALHQIGQFCEIAIVKTGAKGSLVKSRGVVAEIGTIPVELVDTTGAGDLYAAGFLYGHSLGWPLHRCGEAGALLAGNIIGELGAKMGVERWSGIKRWILANG